MNDSGFFTDLDPDALKNLAPNIGCLVTDRVSVEDNPIRYMERYEPLGEGDSGWAFFSGIDEDDEYLNNTKTLIYFH